MPKNFLEAPRRTRLRVAVVAADFSAKAGTAGTAQTVAAGKMLLTTENQLIPVRGCVINGLLLLMLVLIIKKKESHFLTLSLFTHGLDASNCRKFQTFHFVNK